VWNNETEDNSIYAIVEWCCRENEHDIAEKIKEYDQWCMFRAKILDRGSDNYMLLDQLITFINPR